MSFIDNNNLLFCCAVAGIGADREFGQIDTVLVKTGSSFVKLKNGTAAILAARMKTTKIFHEKSEPVVQLSKDSLLVLIFSARWH